MVFIFEPVCTGREHAPFNSGIVEAAMRMSSDRVVFMAEAAHLEAVRELLPGSDECVEYKSVPIPPRRAAGLLVRFAADMRTLRAIARSGRGKRVEAVIATGTSEGGLLAIKMACALLFRCRYRVAVVLHSILGEILSSRSKQMMFSVGNLGPLRFVVLGEHIRANVCSRLPWLSGRMYSIPHPCKAVLEDCSELKENQVAFGFVGIASAAKGFPEFARLVNDVFDRIGSRVHFELVGRCSPECTDLLSQFGQDTEKRLLQACDASGHWPKDIYRDRFSRLSYVVLPYDRHRYQYTCSGVLPDALSMAKPVIALETPGFREVFDSLGDIGYLCSDYQHLLATVLEISHNPPVERYRRQCLNMLAGRHKFGSEQVADQLGKALAGGRG